MRKQPGIIMEWREEPLVDRLHRAALLLHLHNGMTEGELIKVQARLKKMYPRVVKRKAGRSG